MSSANCNFNNCPACLGIELRQIRKPFEVLYQPINTEPGHHADYHGVQYAPLGDRHRHANKKPLDFTSRSLSREKINIELVYNS